MTNDHDPLRDLIHQSLVSDKLTPSAELRTELEQRLEVDERLDGVVVSPAKREPEPKPRRRIVRAWHMALVVTAVLAVMVYLSLPERWQRTMSQVGDVDLRGGWSLEMKRNESSVAESRVADEPAYYQFDNVEYSPAEGSRGLSTLPDYLKSSTGERNEQLGQSVGRENALQLEKSRVESWEAKRGPGDYGVRGALARGDGTQGPVTFNDRNEGTLNQLYQEETAGGEQGSGQGTYTFNGKTSKPGSIPDPTDPTAMVTPRIIIQEEEEDRLGFAVDAAKAQLAVEQSARRAALATLTTRLSTIATDGEKTQELAKLTKQVKELGDQIASNESRAADQLRLLDLTPGTEQYAPIHDNPFLPAKDAPLSTFSIDVDTASYANVRRFLTQGQVPPADAVRIEELLNYFSYDYPAPKGDEPFSVNMETAPCPWRPEHLLLRVGLKGKEVHKAERPASNLVFLIDTSGSMSDEDKLPLVKQAMSMLTRELGERDRITIVTYAGEAGLRLAPTNGGDTSTITSVINSLNSNGSTHGSAGIQLAYEKARESFIKEGTNRVILCTDGDLNVGVTQDDQLVDLISKEAKTGVFLTVLGFGQGNLKDSKMEKIADHGNGVYAYIDGVREAKKVLVDQLSGSLTTIAKDVKIQIEFNPGQVRAYRLIGYENRILAAKDFNDDTKDAGEIGAGHTVTALYELVPAGAAEPQPVLEELKYQKSEVRSQKSEGEEVRDQKSEVSKELLTLKLRFKQPDGDVSKKIEYPLAEKGTRFNNATPDFRFAASVAAFGMILRDSPHRGGITMAGVGEIAASSLGDDARGYRAEFLDLVRRAEKLGKR